MRYTREEIKDLIDDSKRQGDYYERRTADALAAISMMMYNERFKK